MSKTTALKEAEAKPTGQKPWNVHENHLADDERLAAVVAVAEIIERGERSTSSIQEALAKHMPTGTVSRPTAIKYRNAAMQLIAAESKPMNRDNIRALEQGRYTYLIERTYKRILEFEADRPVKTDKDYLKWHDIYVKLLQRLDGFGARLHAITGLNEITINNGSEQKRIVFVRPGDKPNQAIGDSAPIGIAAPSVPPSVSGTPSQAAPAQHAA